MYGHGKHVPWTYKTATHLGGTGGHERLPPPYGMVGGKRMLGLVYMRDAWARYTTT